MFIHNRLTQHVSDITLHTIRSQHIQANTTRGFIQSVSWRWA